MRSTNSQRDEIISALAARIFNTMLDDIIMDAALQAHHEVIKGQTVCKTCNTRCNEVHAPGVGPSAMQNGVSRAGTPTPSAEAKLLNGTTNGNGQGTGTSTPTSAKGDGTLLDCVVCARPMASNRYASHLASCMGLSTARRGAVRGVTKTKSATDIGRSVSPSSELGNVSDDGRPLKGKAKSKSKRVEEAEFNLKRKRPDSPQASPNKAKRPKASGSPISRIKGDTDRSGPKSKVPSKLRDSSTASVVERSQTPSSRSSSPENALAATPTSSTFSHSPKLAHKPGMNTKNSTMKGRVTGTGPPKRFSPPKPVPIHDYSLDDGGEETGSSTDTDST